MSKLTQGHIDTLVNWMKRNPGKSLNVSGTWKNNGFEVIGGSISHAKSQALKQLIKEGYEVDKVNGCIVSKRQINQDDVNAKLSEIAEETIMQELAEVIEPAEDILLKKAKKIANTPPTYAGKHPEAMQKPPIHYNIDLTADNLQSIAKSLQGAIHTAMLMRKKATVNVTVNFE